MPHFDPQAYGPVFAPLLAGDRCRALDAGRAEGAVRDAIRALDLVAALAPHAVAADDETRACLAGAWLLHDFLDESHAVSQGIDTPTGSFWHGIMHRREGDFSNAKYWFRRVGAHAAYAPLAATVGELAATDAERSLAARLAAGGRWDACGFVDACQAALGGGRRDLEPFCRRVQQAEWEILWDCCYQAAIGRGP